VTDTRGIEPGAATRPYLAAAVTQASPTAANATADRLAVDGWWLAQLVDLAPPPPGLHERVYATLTALIEEAR
jgi:hypothetical protein